MSRKSTVTLLDVAARAGVSRTTASAALSRTGRISEETRAHILDVATGMGYQINRAARRLRQERTGAIGIHLPEETTSSSYYMDVTFGIADVLMEHDLALVLHTGSQMRNMLTPDQVDGVVIIDALDDDDVVAGLLAGSLAVVTAEQGPVDLPPARGIVSADHDRGLRSLLQHLVEEGSSRPALISPGTNSAWGRTLASTFTSWCAERSLDPLILDVPFTASPEEATRATSLLLSGPNRPDAVVCGPDGSAVGALTAAAVLGLQVGTDVLIASCVDGPVMKMSEPRITSLDLHPREYGERCARMLLTLLESDDQAQHLADIMPVDLIVRESSKRVS